MSFLGVFEPEIMKLLAFFVIFWIFLLDQSEIERKMAKIGTFFLNFYSAVFRGFSVFLDKFL